MPYRGIRKNDGDDIQFDPYDLVSPPLDLDGKVTRYIIVGWLQIQPHTPMRRMMNTH